jgi:uncharacterized protein
MNDSIIAFIRKQTCATICCVDPTHSPYCFNSFYAFNAETGLLYFKSSAGTTHVNIIQQNPVVAGTILPDKLQLLAIKGIQFEGIILSHGLEETKQASTLYHSRFPLALAMPGEIWTIKLSKIKMTDSSKGFGRKTSWERDTIGTL